MHFDPEKCSDERLFGLVQEQDSQTAFAELYNRYWESLFEQAFQRLKSVDTAEELVQENFCATVCPTEAGSTDFVRK